MELNNIKISIVTIVFNNVKYIEKCITSIINQTYKNYEYIIVDGGSTDGTLNVIEKYKKYITKFISEKDEGLSDAMNKGAFLADGQYIIYLHADDVFINKDVIANAVNQLLINNQPNWMTGFLKYINASDKIFKEDKFTIYSNYSMLLRNIIRHQATFVKTELVKEISFNGIYRYAMDYDFFLRLWLAYGKPVYLLNYVTFFRIDGTSLSSNFYNSIKDEMKVRISFRKNKSSIFWLPHDYFIYVVRVLKIAFFHIKKYENVR